MSDTAAPGDVALVWDAEGLQADWSVGAAGEVALAPPIETAVLVSLFTDARANDDDVLPPGQTDRRGWWGNLLDSQPIGSRLWLLRRAKREPETLRLARDYIREALAWLIEGGLVSRIDVATEWQTTTRIAATIVLHRADGARSTVTAAWAWQGI